jgi:hypothetical protein
MTTLTEGRRDSTQLLDSCSWSCHALLLLGIASNTAYGVHPGKRQHQYASTLAPYPSLLLTSHFQTRFMMNCTNMVAGVSTRPEASVPLMGRRMILK